MKNPFYVLVNQHLCHHQVSTAQLPNSVTELLVFDFLIQCHLSEKVRIITLLPFWRAHFHMWQIWVSLQWMRGTFSDFCITQASTRISSLDRVSDFKQALIYWWALPFVKAEFLGFLYCCIHHCHDPHRQPQWLTWFTSDGLNLSVASILLTLFNCQWITLHKQYNFLRGILHSIRFGMCVSSVTSVWKKLNGGMFV